MKNIRIFYLKIFLFLVVKFSIYLNRHVFVMNWPFGSEEAKKDFQDGGHSGHLGVLIRTI